MTTPLSRGPEAARHVSPLAMTAQCRPVTGQFQGLDPVRDVAQGEDLVKDKAKGRLTPTGGVSHRGVGEESRLFVVVGQGLFLIRWRRQSPLSRVASQVGVATVRQTRLTDPSAHRPKVVCWARRRHHGQAVGPVVLKAWVVRQPQLKRVVQHKSLVDRVVLANRVRHGEVMTGSPAALLHMNRG